MLYQRVQYRDRTKHSHSQQHTEGSSFYAKIYNSVGHDHDTVDELCDNASFSSRFLSLPTCEALQRASWAFLSFVRKWKAHSNALNDVSGLQTVINMKSVLPVQTADTNNVIKFFSIFAIHLICNHHLSDIMDHICPFFLIADHVKVLCRRS